jgi:hypothetical protein
MSLNLLPGLFLLLLLPTLLTPLINNIIELFSSSGAYGYGQEIIEDEYTSEVTTDTGANHYLRTVAGVRSRKCGPGTRQER